MTSMFTMDHEAQITVNSNLIEPLGREEFLKRNEHLEMSSRLEGAGGSRHGRIGHPSYESKIGAAVLAIALDI
jgi:hypothetical protein